MMHEWHQSIWQRWSHRQTTPTALLLAGPSGIGKFDFAQQVAMAALCQQCDPSLGVACGGCAACHLFSQDNHPDRFVCPSEPGKPIGIEAIRDAIFWTQQTSLQGGCRVVMIPRADTLTIQAANALLKTLEEPSEAILFMLISAVPAQLPATIRSRCQLLNLPAATDAQTRQYLFDQAVPADSVEVLARVYAGLPLQALAAWESGEWTAQLAFYQDLQQLKLGQLDPITLAERLKSYAALTVVDWSALWVADGLRLSQQLPPVLLDAIGVKQADLPTRSVRRWFRLWDEIARTRRQLLRQVSVNKSLLFENLCVQLGA